MKSRVRGKKRGWRYSCSALGAADTKPFHIHHEAGSSYPWAARAQFAAQEMSRACSPPCPGAKGSFSPSERALQDFCPWAHHPFTPAGGLAHWSAADIPHFLEGIGACYHLVTGWDPAELHAEHGWPPHPHCSGSQFTSPGALGQALCILGLGYHALTPSWAAQISLHKQWKKCFSHAKNPQGPGFWLRQDPKKRWA